MLRKIVMTKLYRGSGDNFAGQHVQALTAKDVALQPLTRRCDKPTRHVKSSSFHGLWYVGDLKTWDDFESEVQGNFVGVPWNNYSTILAYALLESVSEPHVDAEDHFICGEELSISGRWVQHALQPMSAVGKEPKYGMVFGDWKATSDHQVDFVKDTKPISEEANSDDETAFSTVKKDAVSVDSAAENEPTTKRKRKVLIPDYALLVEENGAPRAVGEAKTPWNDELDLSWYDFVDEKELLGLRRALGQIGNYMIELELKYGFLTNYKWTLFLKREIVNGAERLHCSRPVSYDASPLFKDPISVRQALLLFQSRVVGDKSDWKSAKISDNGIIKKRVNEKVKDARYRVEDTVRQSSEQVPTGDKAVAHLISMTQNLNLEKGRPRRSPRFANPLTTESPS
ncbi:hypothetical protein AJ80_05922 [Polytolypa hystricis UAMH7299]|uniref:Uncharacterized protein n=1 Tax=Polytolypa hystricis (strain UAMH7299) TaxID=1447883 RepID=A0A2B7Y191_POLH7|nr:hypothetical protein AJ80_05922 [Polytolypa hystricis UAMH7299]